MDKGKFLVKAVDLQTTKLAQRLKDKSRKIMCNYNKLRDKHTRN